MRFLPEPWLWHPMAVHFPIVLLNLGFLVEFWSVLGGPSVLENTKGSPSGIFRGGWTAETASWLLWLGTVSAWATMGLGLLAENTAPHVPAAWRALDHHEDFAYWTVGLFTALSLVRWWMLRASTGVLASNSVLNKFFPRFAPAPASAVKYETMFLIGWLIACGVLVTTAYFGGQIVYTFGVGTNLSAGN